MKQALTIVLTFLCVLSYAEVEYGNLIGADQYITLGEEVFL